MSMALYVLVYLTLGLVIGDKNERWLPDSSTILQVLVSLQGLVLTAIPLLNGPQTAFGNHPNKQNISECRRYNEQVFIDSLWLMIHIRRRPPKGFKDFVVEHFRNRAHNIMGACKAYREGAQADSLVKSGFHDVDEGNKSGFLYVNQWKSLSKSLSELVLSTEKFHCCKTTFSMNSQI